MITQADFQVFEVEVQLSGGRGKGTFLRAYTSFDKRLVSALKAQTNATFAKDAAGRAYWSTSADSRYADTFRALIAAAAARLSADAAQPVAAQAKSTARPLRTENLGAKHFPGLRGFDGDTW